MSKLPKFADARCSIVLAVSLLLLAIRPSPDHHVVRQQAQSGYQALMAGQVDRALHALETAVAAEPGLGSLHFVIARLALLSDDLPSARIHLEQAQAWEPTEVDLFCLRTLVNLWDSGLEGSEPPALAATSNCESAMIILNHRIRQLLEENRWQVTNDFIQLALAWQPNDPRFAADLGLLQAISNPDQAIGTLTQANRLGGENDALTLGLIRSIEDSRPAGSLAFTLAQVGQTLARFEMWREAIWAFQHALHLDSEYVEARAYLGLALDQIGEDGYQHLAAAESAFPNAALPHLFLGMHWSTQGELNRAQLELEIAVGLDKTNPSIWAELGSVYAQQGLVAEAKSAFIQAATLAPEEWQFWFLLAQFSLNLEIEIAELGIPAARNLVSLDPSDPRSYDLLGYAHFLNGNQQLADRLLLKAIALQPTSASAQYHLGQLRRWQGNSEQSQAAFEMALQLDPYGPVGQLARRALGLPLTE